MAKEKMVLQLLNFLIKYIFALCKNIKNEGYIMERNEELVSGL